jgi:UPF0755 protein
MGPKRITIGLVFLLGALIAGAAAARVAYFAYTPNQVGSKDTSVLQIKKGESHAEISRLLEAKGVISSENLFLYLGKVTRDWKRIKAGEYEFSPSQTPLEVFAVLTSGISMAHPVTVREGENMYEIAEDIASKGLATKASLVALEKDPKFLAQSALPTQAPTVEGYLFPDTYFFNRSMTPQEMLRQMIKHFQSVWTPEMDARAKEIGMTEHQVVTLASMIEKETGAPDERPMISSVFHNRLQKHIRLESDPTTIYGMWDRFQGKIHKTDLSVMNEYNTYMIPALPVGPIANPGKESLHAALFPNASDYLFFVSHNNGTHEFTKSLEEHQRAVTKFQLDPKAREGKSWRDLNKKSAPSPTPAQKQSH